MVVNVTTVEPRYAVFKDSLSAVGDFIDGVSSFSRLKFWIVLLPIWFVLTLYVFVRAIFMLRAKGLNYFATDEELCEAMKRDKLDRNIV